MRKLGVKRNGLIQILILCSFAVLFSEGCGKEKTEDLAGEKEVREEIKWEEQLGRQR